MLQRLTNCRIIIIIIIIIAGSSMDCPTDIIFVVDESSSIGEANYHLQKDFLSALVGRLDIDSGHTRVGLAEFSTQVNTDGAFNLSEYSSVASVQSAISSLSYSLGTTNTAAVLAYVRITMLTSEAGDRPDAPNVVVVMTDGQSNNRNDTQVWTMLVKGNLK